MDEKIKVLLVEDDPFLSSMYTTKFKMEGFEIYSANDGKTGLNLAVSEKPDIILLDIMIPEMTGFEVLEELKKREDTRDIPVILLTNLSQKDEVEKGLELGAEEYVIKAYITPTGMVDKIKSRFN